MFRVPYRWLPHTAWDNVCWIVSDIRNGICNIIRWTPVIWYDADFDWEYLAKIMEYKLRRSSKFFADHGHHVGSELDAKRMLVCAELLHRLREDHYFDNARKRFGESPLTAKFSHVQQRADQRYLGLILGKYLNHWWD